MTKYISLERLKKFKEKLVSLIPTKLSELENDSEFMSEQDTTTKIDEILAQNPQEFAKSSDLSEYTKTVDLPKVPTKTSELTNDSNFVTTSSTTFLKSTDTTVIKTTGAQTISGKKTFSTLPEASSNPTTANQLARKSYVDSKVPTNISSLNNDVGYIQGFTDANGTFTQDFASAVNSYIDEHSGGEVIVYEPKIGFSETMIDIPEIYYDDYGNMMTRPKDNPATDTYMTSCDTWSCDISNSENGQLMWKQDYTSTMYSTYCSIAFKNETLASNFKLEANLQPQTDGMYLPRVPYMLIELNYNTGNYNYNTGRYEYGDNFTYCCIKPTPTSGVLTFDSTDTWYSKDKNGTDLTPIDLSTVTFNPTVFQQSEYGDYKESYFTVNINLRGTIESTIEAAQSSWEITGYNAFYYGDMFKYVFASVSTIDSCRKSFLQAIMRAAPSDSKPAKCKMAIVESEDETKIIDFAEDCKATMSWNGDNEVTTVKGTGIKLFHKFDDELKQIMVDYELVAIADMMSKDITSWVQKITYNGEEIQVKEESFNGGGGSTEVAISETEPTGDETIWINPSEIQVVQSSSGGGMEETVLLSTSELMYTDADNTTDPPTGSKVIDGLSDYDMVRVYICQSSSYTFLARNGKYGGGYADIINNPESSNLHEVIIRGSYSSETSTSYTSTTFTARVPLYIDWATNTIKIYSVENRLEQRSYSTSTKAYTRTVTYPLATVKNIYLCKVVGYKFK